jgi:molecular chaperone GrpE
MSKKRKKDRQAQEPAAEAEQAAVREDAVPAAPPGAAGASESLEADVARERDELLGRLQRLGADFQNYQKRVQKDIAHARQFANEALIRSLLGVLDDMERALEAARANHARDDPLLTGMQMVHDKALRALGEFGLEPIEAEGRPFDPEHHAAMLQEPTREHPPQTVLREVQRGYTLKGRTLRPAGVVVSAEPAGPDDGEASSEAPRDEQS